MSKLISIGSFFCLLVGLAGCESRQTTASYDANSLENDVAKVQTATEQASTPEEVFAKAQAAMEQNDWRTIHECCAPESRAIFSFLAVFGAQLNALKDEAKKQELDELCENHGLDPEKKLTANFMKDPQTAADELLAAVEDRKAFFIDVMDWNSNNSDKDAVSELVGKLEHVTIDGTSAIGTVVERSHENKAETKELKFRQVDGNWYLHFDVN